MFWPGEQREGALPCPLKSDPSNITCLCVPHIQTQNGFQKEANRTHINIRTFYRILNWLEEEKLTHLTVNSKRISFFITNFIFYIKRSSALILIHQLPQVMISIYRCKCRHCIHLELHTHNDNKTTALEFSLGSLTGWRLTRCRLGCISLFFDDGFREQEQEEGRT